MAIPLTEMFGDEFSAKLAETPRGMAYLKGTGPKGETCRTCGHFIENGRYAGNPKGVPPWSLMPGRCQKYRQMTASNRLGTPKIKHSLAACKYWTDNVQCAPPISKRPW